MELKDNSPDTQSCCSVGSRWKFPLMLAVLLLGMLMWNRGQLAPPGERVSSAASGWTPSSQPIGEVVQLEIDFGNGARRRFDALAWHADMTVEDVLVAAREFRPSIGFTQIGSGAGGFLSELEGLKNEGASGRNWQYEVAGTPASVSFCLQKVAPGELVRWTFAGEDKGL